MTFTRKAQGQTRLEPFIGLYVTIVVNSVMNLVSLAVWYLLGNRVAVSGSGFALLALGGIFNSFVGRGLLFMCVSMLGAARAGLMKATMPVFVVIGGVFILREQLAPNAWLGISVILCGLLLMSIDAVRRGNKEKALSLDAASLQAEKLSKVLKGMAVGLAAALFLATGNLFRKSGVTLIPDSIFATAVAALFALLASTIALLCMGKGGKMLYALRHLEKYYVISGVFSGGALYSLFGAMLFIPISIANSLSSLEPIFTMICVKMLLKGGKAEHTGLSTLFCGMVMVIGALILVLG